MESLLTYIGSFASIGGIPLAIYLYLKSREGKIDKIRRDILQIISYQIGEDRRLNTFEIEKVISSNIRNNKLAIESITVGNIIEDLISDTISSPLLNSESKNKILENLKDIFPSPMADFNSKKSQVDTSNVFATVISAIFILQVMWVVTLGEEGWSDKAEWWISLNSIEGYLPNLVFSVFLALASLFISFAFAKLIKSHNKSSNSDAEGAGS